MLTCVFQHALCRLLVLIHALLWISVAQVTAAASSSPDDVVVHGDVHHDQITITLPVFITALGSCIGITWLIARYDAQRNRRLDRIEFQLKALLQRHTADDTARKDDA